MPNTVISSMWRNDATRNLMGRAEHLLLKWQPGVRYVWVVGDSSDDTEAQLRDIVEVGDWPVEIIRHDTGIVGEDANVRLRRMSLTASAGFDQVRADDEWWILHESDLISPINLVDLMTGSGFDVLGGWVTLGDMFYDTYAYRKDGKLFTNHPPYHACYKPDEPFELDCIGSVMMFPARELRIGVRCDSGGVVELCRQFTEDGLRIWCDPRIKIQQPVELWESRGHASI